MIHIFPCGSPLSRGAFRQQSFSATSDRGAGTPKLAQTFAYGKWLLPYTMLPYGASDLDQICQKTHNSEDGCTFPPNIFAPSPKTPFWGPFNAKPITQRALRNSIVNGATKLKLYSYIGIGKYLGCQNFSARGSPGAYKSTTLLYLPYYIKCGLTAPKIAKNSNFWYKFSPKGYINLSDFFLQYFAWGGSPSLQDCTVVRNFNVVALKLAVRHQKSPKMQYFW